METLGYVPKDDDDLDWILDYGRERVAVPCVRWDALERVRMASLDVVPKDWAMGVAWADAELDRLTTGAARG